VDLDFVLSTSGRTGSNVLQRLLRNNGVCDPNEWFHPRFGFGDAVANGVSTEEWLAETRRKQARNHTFGVKVMAVTMDLMGRHMRPPEPDRGAVLTRLLPGARYVFLYREDTFRQAISSWRALVSRQWIQRLGEEHVAERVPLDLERFKFILGGIDMANRFWAGFFEREGIAPHVISYEHLVEHPGESLAEVGDFLGIELGDEPDLAMDIVRQADELTELYLAEVEARLGDKRPGVWLPSTATRAS
jgi:trehalose 2-sulfotransferase